MYTTEKEFRGEENLHLVTPDSGYGWKDGATKKSYGWVAEKHCRYDESSSGANHFGAGVRRFRSLFQLSREVKSTAKTRKKSKRSNTDQKNDQAGKKKKRKRY